MVRPKINVIFNDKETSLVDHRNVVEVVEHGLSECMIKSLKMFCGQER